MRAWILAACFGLAACSSDGAVSTNVDAPLDRDAPPGDAGGCTINLTFDPSPAVAEPDLRVRVVAHVYGAPGVLAYTWHAYFAGNELATTSQAIDHSQIDFPAPNAGPYRVTADVDYPGCPTGDQTLSVGAPGANIADYRLRVVPPASLAPPQETVIQIYGGADVMRSVALDPGLAVTGTVTDGTTGVPAYVKFMPSSAPLAIVETFSQTDGSFAVRLLGQAHEVLVVPAVAGLAPAKLMWMPGDQSLTLGPGTAVSGVVKDPAGAVLAGAKVQLASADGVPSTLTTTAADGSFTVRTAFAPNQATTVTVTPPVGRGLPRLSATALFDLTQALVISYAASLTTCDLSGTPVKRNATNQPGAQIIVVGTLAAAAGTVSSGAVVPNATGSFGATVTADGTGVLPHILVPRGSLQAVVVIAPGDLAVASLDTSSCAAQTIAAPATTMAAGVTSDGNANLLGGVNLEATPSGALALAGMPPVLATSDGTGAFSIGLAAGGSYDLRFYDPAGRAAPLVFLGATTPPTAAILPAAVHVTGAVSVAGNPNPVEGASVQILSGSTGLDATRPITQTATDAHSNFRIAVPDPGTM